MSCISTAYTMEPVTETILCSPCVTPVTGVFQQALHHLFLCWASTGFEDEFARLYVAQFFSDWSFNTVAPLLKLHCMDNKMSVWAERNFMEASICELRGRALILEDHHWPPPFFPHVTPYSPTTTHTHTHQHSTSVVGITHKIQIQTQLQKYSWKSNYFFDEFALWVINY